jgi:hypothetical protein
LPCPAARRRPRCVRLPLRYPPKTLRNTTFAERAGRRRSRSISSRPFRKQQKSTMTKPRQRTFVLVDNDPSRAVFFTESGDDSFLMLGSEILAAGKRAPHQRHAGIGENKPVQAIGFDQSAIAERAWG